MANKVDPARVESLLDAFIRVEGPHFTRAAAIAGVSLAAASRAWHIGWPSVGIPPLCKTFYEKTGKAPPLNPPVFKPYETTDELPGGAAPGSENGPTPQNTPATQVVNGIASDVGAAPPPVQARPEVRVVLLDQKEIDRRVAAAVGVVKRDVAAALESENRMLKIVRNNTVGLAVSLERTLLALQPLIDGLPEQIALERAAGTLTVAKTLEMIARVAKTASTITYVAKAAMETQRLLAGMPQQIAEVRTSEADPRSPDPTDDMTTKLLTTLARAHTQAQGGHGEDEYSGEESGRPDAIDVEVEPKP